MILGVQEYLKREEQTSANVTIWPSELDEAVDSVMVPERKVGVRLEKRQI
jgi:hypothetical protein